MKAVVIIVATALAALFILSFGGGLGYAKGGGTATVRILTDEVVASSESGQAVAVGWSDVENFNASNTPLSKPAPGRTFWDALPMLALLGVAGIFLMLIVNRLKPPDDGDWQPDPDAQPHHSGEEAAEWEQRYGPL